MIGTTQKAFRTIVRKVAVEGRCKVIGTTQKAQSPAATGLSADENTSTDIVSLKRGLREVAQKLLTLTDEVEALQ